ncbi:MAG: hypothetical protein V2B15_15165 [Bacteroidota bacterium]
MIKKSILIFLVLVVAWAIIIRVVPFSASQHQWQENIIKAEQYIYGSETIDNVMVGSSLSTRLQTDSLNAYYNLALSGQGILDGLNVLRRKKELPERVIVEINFLDRGENETFSNLVFSPTSFFLKRYFRILRAGQQPLTAVGNGILIPLFELISGKKEIDKGEAGTGTEGEAGTAVSDELFHKMVETNRDLYTEPIDTATMDQQFEKLSDHIQYLKSNGVDVVFYEMPVNHQLTKLAKANYLRNRIMNDFHDEPFIGLPDYWERIITTDGLHLTDGEATSYTRYLRNELSKLDSADQAFE